MVHRSTAATAAGVLSIGVVLIPTGEREFPTLQTHHHFLQLTTASLKCFQMGTLGTFYCQFFSCKLPVAKFITRACSEDACSKKSRSGSPERSHRRAALLSVNALCCGSVSSGFLGCFFFFASQRNCIEGDVVQTKGSCNLCPVENANKLQIRY